MLKHKVTSGLAILALFAFANVGFAQEKAFTENASVLSATNITLTGSTPVALGVGKQGNARIIEMTPNQTARIYVLLSASSTASAAVTNALSAGTGVICLGGTNTGAKANVVLGRNSPMGYWSKYIYIASPDSTGTVSVVEVGR